jgi:hypothetical protein
MSTLHPTRRTLVKGAAWTVPVISIAAAAPAYASSTTVIVSGPATSKCSGRSAGGSTEFTYIFTFTTDGALANATVANLVINGTVFAVDRVVVEGSLIHVVSTSSSDSANAAGTGVLTYTVDGTDRTFPFTYSGTHPDQELCRRLA